MRAEAARGGATRRHRVTAWMKAPPSRRASLGRPKGCVSETYTARRPRPVVLGCIQAVVKETRVRPGRGFFTLPFSRRPSPYTCGNRTQAASTSRNTSRSTRCSQSPATRTPLPDAAAGSQPDDGDDDSRHRLIRLIGAASSGLYTLPWCILAETVWPEVRFIVPYGYYIVKNFTVLVYVSGTQPGPRDPLNTPRHHHPVVP